MVPATETGRVMPRSVNAQAGPGPADGLQAQLGAQSPVLKLAQLESHATPQQNESRLQTQAWQTESSQPAVVAAAQQLLLPGSTLHVLEHPSPLVTLPSSHCSPGSSRPLPQQRLAVTGDVAMHAPATQAFMQALGSEPAHCVPSGTVSHVLDGSLHSPLHSPPRTQGSPACVHAPP